ncbi:hypothetical protein A2V95_00915, partial [Candidatus Kuenenbacteria bacterium RBG_16_41_7]
MRILGIETSCDETAAAIVEFKRGSFKIIAQAVASSAEVQAQYGGIVPEVAARKQIELILPVVEAVLQEATGAVDKPELRIMNYELRKLIDYIAVTNGPGLITSLRVGVEAAKTLGFIWHKPIIAVNHLEGHIYSALLKQNKYQIPNPNFQINPKSQIPKFKKIQKIQFPALALVVSGGHTELVLMKDYLKYRVVGRTLDDAAGEALDKVAKILGLGYPGGPIIAKLAAQGDKNKYKFPRPMLQSGDDNFSFAGLKTAVLYKVKGQKVKGKSKEINDMCASFQEACVEVLAEKTVLAASKRGVKII